MASTQTIPSILEEKLQAALLAVGGDLPENFHATVSPAADTRFGDYQSNSAMVLAKRLKTNPRELAQKVIDEFDAYELCSAPEIAGPGFINFKIRNEYLAARISALLADDRLGVPALEKAEKYLIDYSSPNVAKPMHIGHIRSTIIGDCIARTARFLGHNVLADNHIGDWGTPIGQILYGWKNHLDQPAFDADPIAELLRLYKKVKVEFKEDPVVKAACQEETVKLQSQDEENIALWKQFLDLTSAHSAKTYQRLDIHFDLTLGESFYDDRLAAVVETLISDGIARESDGAICVFSNGDLDPKEDPLLVHRDGEWVPAPCIIRKSDGAFNYHTTDIATIDYRIEEHGADDILYVVDDRQTLHFRQLFEVARQRGIKASLTHVKFGKILKPDRTPFSSRDGDAPALDHVLEEAVKGARKVVEEKSATLPEEEKTEIAECIGIGSVKYAELSQSRSSDYVFSYDKMLALQGNTAPYLLNAYVRTRAIFRKLDGEIPELSENLSLTEAAEKTIAVKICQYGEIVPAIMNDHRPNLLANYLYELAQTFHSFYENCPVLSSEGATRSTRLALCEATSQVLRHGLGLLGIKTIEKM